MNHPAARTLARRVTRHFARRTDAWLAGSLIVAAIYFFSGYFTSVRFDRERIVVRVEPGRVIVTGLYHYTNVSELPAVLTLRIPFPVDDAHPTPSVYGLSEASADGRVLQQLRSVDRKGKVTLRLLFRPGENKWIRLDYVQPSRVPRGRYILETTRAWRRALARGEYMIRLPRDAELTSSNYPVALTPDSGPGKAYGFSATDFFPERDWEFSWESQPTKEVVRETQGPRRLHAGMVSDVGPTTSVRQ